MKLYTILIWYCYIKFIDLFSQYSTKGLNHIANHTYRPIKPNVSGLYNILDTFSITDGRRLLRKWPKNKIEYDTNLSTSITCKLMTSIIKI